MEALDEKKIELIDDFKQADANGDDIVTKKEAIRYILYLLSL